VTPPAEPPVENFSTEIIFSSQANRRFIEAATSSLVVLIGSAGFKNPPLPFDFLLRSLGSFDFAQEKLFATKSEFRNSNSPTAADLQDSLRNQGFLCIQAPSLDINICAITGSGLKFRYGSERR
jgi:hypothetical protein